MNPIAIAALVATVAGGLAIATRKRNASAQFVEEFWRLVAAGETSETVLQIMLGADIRLPSGALFDRAAYIVAEGHPGRGMDADDPYTNPETGVTRADPHWGYDIVAAIGTEVLSAKTGIVTYCENRIAGYGRMIWVSHLDRDNESTLYAHLDGFNVGLGQLVYGGSIIGFVGNTCAPEGVTPPCWCRRQPNNARCVNAAGVNTSRTMGAHVHFEVHTSRIPVTNDRPQQHLDPVAWLEENGIDAVGIPT
jgi:murein DD-endopeptidase MepM/ murein hydrolase activator NlpD